MHYKKDYKSQSCPFKSKMSKEHKDFEEPVKIALDDLCRATISTDPLMAGLYRKMGLPTFIRPLYERKEKGLQLNYTWQIRRESFIVYRPYIELEERDEDDTNALSPTDSSGSAVTVNSMLEREGPPFRLEIDYWFNLNRRLSEISSNYGEGGFIPREIRPIKQRCDALSKKLQSGQEIDEIRFIIEFSPVVDHLKRIMGL